MSILTMKSEFLLPEKELIINKGLILHQKSALISAITEQAGVIKIWLFWQMPDVPPPNTIGEEFLECATRRDEILRRASQTRIRFRYIQEFTIQGIKLPTTGASYTFAENDKTIYIKLQHFAEAGVDFSSIENVSFNELVLTEYQLQEGTVFPKIDTSADMPVSISLSEEFCEVLVEPSHYFNLEIGRHDISRSFKDHSSGREITYHIKELILYDIWKETTDQFQDEEVIRKLCEQGHDDVSIEKMKADIPESLEHICPKNHVLPVLIYECADDINLNFYTTKFLHESPKYNGSSTVSAACLVITSDTISHGNNARSHVLNAVPIGYDRTFEIELMTWLRKIPAETVDFPDEGEMNAVL